MLLIIWSVMSPWPALAQDAQAAEGSPSPSPAASNTPVDSPALMASMVDPAWSRLQPGRSPAAREDHTWTVDEAGTAAFLFGGRDGSTVHDDLWRFDLSTDTWTRLRPSGPLPDARFGHSAAWVPGTGLVIFAGQRGTDFFNDLWAYEPGSDTWTRLPDGGGKPAPRYGSCAVVDADGDLVISHGFTFRGRFDDTRSYDFGAQRWSSVAPDGRRPGERCLHECFTTTAGQLVLYGGQDNQNASLGDLWSTRPDGSWERRTDPKAVARRLYAVTEAGPDAWIFGGAGRDGAALDDLWRVDRTTLEFRRVRTSGDTPAPRWAGTLVTDSARGRLLLFGGMGANALADVWQLRDEAASEGGPAEAPQASESPTT